MIRKERKKRNGEKETREKRMTRMTPIKMRRLEEWRFEYRTSEGSGAAVKKTFLSITGELKRKGSGIDE